MKRSQNPFAGFDPAYVAAKEKLLAGKIPKTPVPKRQYGRTKEELSIIGLEGARSKNVRSAVIKGASFFRCAVFVFVLPLFFLSIRGEVPLNSLLVGISFAAIVIGTASLVSGMAAIVVRDCQEFGRWRLFPQFSLQGLMIVVTFGSNSLECNSEYDGSGVIPQRILTLDAATLRRTICCRCSTAFLR